jgi:hypothetical protein
MQTGHAAWLLRADKAQTRAFGGTHLRKNLNRRAQLFSDWHITGTPTNE